MHALDRRRVAAQEPALVLVVLRLLARAVALALELRDVSGQLAALVAGGLHRRAQLQDLRVVVGLLRLLLAHAAAQRLGARVRAGALVLEPADRRLLLLVDLAQAVDLEAQLLDQRLEAGARAALSLDLIDQLLAVAAQARELSRGADTVGRRRRARRAALLELRTIALRGLTRPRRLGARLVDECIRFARSAGYRKIVLWTQSELLAARRVYERAGFTRRAAKPHCSFGRKLVAETWELAL